MKFRSITRCTNRYCCQWIIILYLQIVQGFIPSTIHLSYEPLLNNKKNTICTFIHNNNIGVYHTGVMKTFSVGVPANQKDSFCLYSSSSQYDPCNLIDYQASDAYGRGNMHLSAALNIGDFVVYQTGSWEVDGVLVGDGSPAKFVCKVNMFPWIKF